MHPVEKRSLYILPTDEQERKRLELQNEVLRTAFGGIIFAPIELRTGDKVLDSGTGSATWLIDCYNANKDVTLHGIDLKTDIFPTLDDEQKRGIHLEAGNILQLPSNWTGKFRLVNQRLLIAGLSKENWKTALEEMYRVVAPGGWVQLVEASHCTSGEATQKLQILNVLRDTGFEQFKTRRHEISIGGSEDEDGMNVKARENMISVYKGMQTPVVELGIRSEADFKEIIDGIEKEWESNVQSKAIFNLFVAQKPPMFS